MSSNSDFPVVFEQLKSILKPYASKLNLKADTKDSYYLEGTYSNKWRKELFFGSVQIKRSYVSFYLMPVYMYPTLIKNISPELKKHMQGKSCFNFKKVEQDLFKELDQLTNLGYEQFMREEYS